MKQPRADAKLKTLPEEEQAELFALFTANELRPALTLEQVQAEVPLRYGFTVSMGSLSSWRSWWALRSRMEAAKARAEQARLELLAQSPDMDPAKLEAVAQMVFTAETLEGGDVKSYVALAKLRLDKAKVDLDSRRIVLLEQAAREAKEKLQAVLSGAQSKGGLTEETLKRIEEAANLL